MKLLGAAILAVTISISSGVFAAPSKDVPAALQKAASCMFDILNAKPGFEKAELGIFESNGFRLPDVQYLSPADSVGRRITVRFGAIATCAAVNRTYNCCQDKDRYCFLAVLGGLSSPKGPGPPDGSVNVLIKEWNATCGVDAFALFV